MKTTVALMTSACILGLVLSVSANAQEKPPAAPPLPPAPPGLKTPATGEPTPPWSQGKQMFQPVSVDPAVAQASMQAQSELNDLNRRIMDRQIKLYGEDPQIKDLQTKMKDLQKKIDAILAADDELNNLKAKMKEVAPEMPTGGFKKNAGPGAGGPLMAPAANKAKTGEDKSAAVKADAKK